MTNRGCCETGAWSSCSLSVADTGCISGLSASAVFGRYILVCELVCEGGAGALTQSKGHTNFTM